MIQRQDQQQPTRLALPDPQAEQVRADAIIRAHYQHPMTAVVIPLLQSLVSGASIGAAAASIAVVANYAHPWHIFGVGMTCVQAGSWLLLLRRWLDVTWALDTWAPDRHHDDQPEPAPAVTVESLRLQIQQDNRTQIININVPAERIYEAAALVIGGAPFAERELAGAGRPLSQREFRLLRDELLRRQYLAWKNSDPHQGVEITPAGQQLFIQLAALAGATTPLPHMLQ
jgi:hypothetical protein